jgi:hypothetical protein
MTRRLILPAAAVGLALALASTAAAPAWATHQGDDVLDQVSVQISYQTSRMPGISDQLVVELRGEDGTAVVGAEVEFLREVEFLGSRRILLGRAVTDAAGSAYLPIRPTESEIRIVARFQGSERHEPTQLGAWIVVPPDALRPDQGGHLDGGTASLAMIAETMPLVLALVALAVWILLIGLASLTVLAIRKRPQGRKESR